MFDRRLAAMFAGALLTGFVLGSAGSLAASRGAVVHDRPALHTTR